jgi:hypothetical protein
MCFDADLMFHENQPATHHTLITQIYFWRAPHKHNAQPHGYMGAVKKNKWTGYESEFYSQVL